MEATLQAQNPEQGTENHSGRFPVLSHLLNETRVFIEIPCSQGSFRVEGKNPG